MKLSTRPNPSHWDQISAKIELLKASRALDRREYRKQLRLLKRARREGPGMEE